MSERMDEWMNGGSQLVKAHNDEGNSCGFFLSCKTLHCFAMQFLFPLFIPYRLEGDFRLSFTKTTLEYVSHLSVLCRKVL